MESFEGVMLGSDNFSHVDDLMGEGFGSDAVSERSEDSSDECWPVTECDKDYDVRCKVFLKDIHLLVTFFMKDSVG